MDRQLARRRKFHRRPGSNRADLGREVRRRALAFSKFWRFKKEKPGQLRADRAAPLLKLGNLRGSGREPQLGPINGVHYGLGRSNGRYRSSTARAAIAGRRDTKQAAPTHIGCARLCDFP